MGVIQYALNLDLQIFQLFSCFFYTDYGNFLANESLPISTSTISERASQIMVDQFNFIKSNAVEPLTTFLDYITCVIAPLNLCSGY